MPPPGAFDSDVVTASKNVSECLASTRALAVSPRSAHSSSCFVFVPTVRQRFAVEAPVGPAATVTASRHSATRACPASWKVYSTYS